jgi:2-dehydropantoate 2-reductase
MRVLFLGAGVIGSLYAARLRASGHEVVILARGSRLAAIRRDGLLLEDAGTHRQTSLKVPVISHLADDDPYDLVVVPVRFDQLASALDVLAKSSRTPNVLFFGNNPLGADRLIAALGRTRVLLGFPGAGGQHEGELIRYLVIRQQRTTLGELDGSRTPRIREIAVAFRTAGFPIAFSPDMRSWLKTHAAFVSLVSAAIYASQGDSAKLAASPRLLHLMVRAVRESFQALATQGIRDAPFNLRLLHGYMPEWFAVRYWRQQFSGELGKFSLASHALSARSEMTLLAGDVRALLAKSSSKTPYTNELFREAGFS